MNESEPNLAQSLQAAQQKLRLAESACDYFDQLVDMSDAYSFNDQGGPRSEGYLPGGVTDPGTAYSRSLIYPGATAWAYINEIELRQIRARTRVFGQTNPYAIGAGRNRVAYVVGNGHTYKVLPRDPDDADEQTLEDCRTVLDDFRKRNQWPKRQKETVRRLDRDGERFLRLFADETRGELNVRFVEPLEIQNPPGETAATGCYFGIGFKKIAGGDTQPVWDIETPETYYVVNIGTLGEVIGLREAVPASEMQHLKANVDMTWPRGLPTFWVMMPHLANAVQTLRATGKIVEFRARIGMIRRHINAAKESVQHFVARAKEDKAGRTPTAGQYPYAAIIDTSDATEYQFPAGTVPVDGNVAAIQAELRAVAASLAMPEYMLSGDASNANFSSTMVAEGPAVKTFEEMQAELIDADIEIMERQLVVAARAGLIDGASDDEETDDYILKLVKVEAEPPIIKSENRLQEVQADNVLYTAKVMSKETFAARNGLVYADEEDKIEIEGESDAGYGGDWPPGGAVGTNAGDDPSEPQPGNPAQDDDWMLKEGMQEGGPGSGPHAAGENTASPDANKYQHLAHLLNGQKVMSDGHSKDEAKKIVMALRAKGIYASGVQDPKAPKGKQFLVAVPKDHQEDFQEDDSGVASIRILEPPDVRQENHWECGAASSACVGGLFGVGPKTLQEWSDALGTTEAKSTAPAAIVSYFQKLGCQVVARDNLTLADLIGSVNQGWPVICPVQDYMGERSKNAAWDYGHYLTVIGVVPGYVVVQDSSIENLQREPGGDVPPQQTEKSGNLAAPGRVLIRFQDWQDAWHDMDESGNKLVRYGISVGR